MKPMSKTFSNTYILLYITGLVIIIAMLLSAVSLGLKPQREANRQCEKARQILKAAGYGDVDKGEANALFSQVTRPEKSKTGREMYAIQCADGSQGHVVYVNGKGLWGAIWGYVVLNEDNTTIKGVAFSHKSETPGLGAKITEDDFSSSFIGKKLYDENGNFVSVKVIAKGKGNAIAAENRVDAISGATLTSRGVDEMMYNSLIEIMDNPNNQ